MAQIPSRFLRPFEKQILPSLNESQRAGEYPIPPGTYPGVGHLTGRLRHDMSVTATRMVLVARAWLAGWYTFTGKLLRGGSIPDIPHTGMQTDRWTVQARF